MCEAAGTWKCVTDGKHQTCTHSFVAETATWKDREGDGSMALLCEILRFSCSLVEGGNIF
jgi:hypothetical protein